MNCKKYLKPGIVLPIIFGITSGSVLVFSRIFDDIPGLPLVIIILCFGCIYYGVYNINKINNKIKPKIIVPLLFGILGILGAFIILCKKEFDDAPGVLLITGALCTGLIFAGLFNIKSIRQKIEPGIAVPMFYCVCGIALSILLKNDGELTKTQMRIIIMVFIFIAAVSIVTVVLIKRIKLLNMTRHSRT